MIKHVKQTIKKYDMIRRGDTVAAAVSGGADSVVMLRVLHKLSDEMNFTLVVCHLDHGLRGEESKRDYDFTARLADELGLPFEGGSLEPDELKDIKGVSVQEAARVKRYEFLEEAAARVGAQRIALGHTLDDQAETVLMRFVKGSGLSGLSGMPPVRGRLVRPLIETPRGEIERFAEKEGVAFVEDSSNAETRYLRNDLRKNLIPFIEQHYNPRIKHTLAREAALLAQDDEFLKRQADGVFPDMVTERGKGTLTLDRKKLGTLHESLLARVFLIAVEILKEKTDLYSYHVKSFLKVVRGRRPNASLALPNGLTIEREYERVIISAEPVPEVEPYDVRMRLSGATRVPEAGVEFRASVLRKPTEKFERGNVAYFDHAKLPRPVRVRTFSHGDRMAPMGMGGRHKKLKEIFIENKVPQKMRHALPLVTAGDEIVWAVGLRRTEHYKVDESTQRVLRVECKVIEEEAPEKEKVEATQPGRRPGRGGRPQRGRGRGKGEKTASAPEKREEKAPGKREDKEDKRERPRRDPREEKPSEVAAEGAGAGEEKGEEKKPAGKRRRRRRRSKKKGGGEEKSAEKKPAEAEEKKPEEKKAEGETGETGGDKGEKKPAGKRRRRRRSRGRGRGRGRSGGGKGEEGGKEGEGGPDRGAGRGGGEKGNNEGGEKGRDEG